MTNEETIAEENLKKRLELELGLPLTPKSVKKIERNFDDDQIIVEFFPINEINVLKIGEKILTNEDYFLNESGGIIYLTENHKGMLYLEYSYALDESEWKPLLDLMVEYENDNSWDKDASSIKENNVTVSYDTSVGKGARIQSMIVDLRNKYSCVVEMI